MNPSLLGAAAATLLVLLWLVTRRRPRPFLRSDDSSAVAALNRAQLERLPSPRDAFPSAARSSATTTVSPPLLVPSPSGPFGASTDPTGGGLPIPARGNRRESQQLRARLAAAARGSLAERIEAMRTARRWGHRSVLPLLRQGLRDVHPAVVREATLALEAYRGRSTASSAPRTVLRTR